MTISYFCDIVLFRTLYTGICLTSEAEIKNCFTQTQFKVNSNHCNLEVGKNVDFESSFPANPGQEFNYFVAGVGFHPNGNDTPDVMLVEYQLRNGEGGEPLTDEFGENMTEWRVPGGTFDEADLISAAELMCLNDTDFIKKVEMEVGFMSNDMPLSPNSDNETRRELMRRRSEKFSESLKNILGDRFEEFVRYTIMATIRREMAVECRAEFDRAILVSVEVHGNHSKIGVMIPRISAPGNSTGSAEHDIVQAKLISPRTASDRVKRRVHRTILLAAYNEAREIYPKFSELTA